MKYGVLVDKEIVQETDPLKWAKNFETSNRLVEKTDFHNGIVISTVFLGISHGYPFGEPLWFETMLFGHGGEEYQVRTPDWDKAKEAHKDAVAFALETYGCG